MKTFYYHPLVGLIPLAILTAYAIDLVWTGIAIPHFIEPFHFKFFYLYQRYKNSTVPARVPVMDDPSYCFVGQILCWHWKASLLEEFLEK